MSTIELKLNLARQQFAEARIEVLTLLQQLKPRSVFCRLSVIKARLD